MNRPFGDRLHTTFFVLHKFHCNLRVINLHSWPALEIVGSFCLYSKKRNETSSHVWIHYKNGVHTFYRIKRRVELCAFSKALYACVLVWTVSLRSFAITCISTELHSWIRKKNHFVGTSSENLLKSS